MASGRIHIAPPENTVTALRRTRTWAWLLFPAMLLVYNSNGREIQSYDSQPTKFAARELALHGRLTLDAVVAAAPPLAERAAFQRDVSGRFRSWRRRLPSPCC